MPKSSLKRMEFQGTVEIDRLLAERPGLHGIEYLVRWKNYNHYGDTWEPHEHIYPPSKLTTFYSRPTIQVSLTIPVWLLRDSIARQCSQRKISERGPVFRRTVPVDGLIVPEVGKAVIDHIRRLFSPQLFDEERQHIVTHAKQELRQRWAPMPIPHRLLTGCWHLLPAEKWSLPQSKSNAREKKPKPKPKPIIAKTAWRGRGERVQRRKLLVDVDV